MSLFGERFQLSVAIKTDRAVLELPRGLKSVAARCGDARGGVDEADSGSGRGGRSLRSRRVRVSVLRCLCFVTYGWPAGQEERKREEENGQTGDRMLEAVLIFLVDHCACVCVERIEKLR